MPDYEKMYQELFRAAVRAIEILQQAQIKTEEMYISAEEPELSVLMSEPDGKGFQGHPPSLAEFPPPAEIK